MCPGKRLRRRQRYKRKSRTRSDQGTLHLVPDEDVTHIYALLSLYSQTVRGFRWGRKKRTRKETQLCADIRTSTGSHENRHPHCSCKNSVLDIRLELEFACLRHLTSRLNPEPDTASAAATVGFRNPKIPPIGGIRKLQDGRTPDPDQKPRV